jgi:hypothetical protein
LFDFLTFGVMLGLFHAGSGRFRSGWFVESLVTQTLVIFAIRTRRVPFLRSRPSILLERLWQWWRSEPRCRFLRLPPCWNSEHYRSGLSSPSAGWS